MSSASLYRWSGIALLIGCLLGVIGTIMSAILYPGHTLTAQQVLNTPFTGAAFLFLGWGLGLSLGLPGFYLRQAARAGVLGFVGFVLLFLGLLLGAVGFGIVQITIFPYLAQLAPRLLPSGGTGPDLGFVLWILGPNLLLAIGAILLGIATRRTHVFPRWTGLLLIVAGILFILSIPPIPSPIGDVIDIGSSMVLFVALGWSGYALVAHGKESVAAPFATAEAQPSR